MANSFFKFKQFTVWHDKCAMKVGTDGVLLGAWTSIENAQRIMDVGTGTGLVALMLAQRSLPNTNIIALEIDEAAYMQAKDNVNHSPWKDRVEVLHKDFKLFSSNEKFDIIVSNPPYFVDSLTCVDNQRNTARHNNSLTYENLIQGSSNLLSPQGELTIIIPFDTTTQLKKIALTCNLYAIRQLNIVTKPGGQPKRSLITFSFSSQEYKEDYLLTEVARHQYSKEYAALTQEYYLHI